MLSLERREVAAIASSLLAAGHTNIVIANLPPLELTPYGQMEPEFLDEIRLAVKQVNRDINETVQSLRETAPPGANILLWDWNRLARQIGEEAGKGWSPPGSPTIPMSGFPLVLREPALPATRFLGAANSGVFGAHPLQASTCHLSAVDDPSRYGLANVTAPCLLTNASLSDPLSPTAAQVSVCDNPDRYLFW